MTDLRQFQGQRALVMGGSSGIGEATAARFAALGAAVTITGRRETALKEAADRIQAATGTAVDAVRLDAAETAALAAFFAPETGYDHLVLALSGSNGAGPIATLDLDDLAAGFEGKFWPHLRTLQAALPRLNPGASVTFISAVSARAAMPGTAGLAAVNGAIEAMVAPLAAELAPIRVNAVSPGVVDTPWWSGVPEAQRKALFDQYASVLPVGRVGNPAEVGEAVAFLAGNGYTTGTVLEVAGGAQLAKG
ncbi:SDR family oxidoreductase [Glycomyces artemisiae]|uniref:NAD(P)-dependent dehydrogenase (Short-subunit alcohol dehydrogenase family) n=1 Tax=Glycomyces artemisiae TaxID=1076443 RepID=A0A2T0USN2_9ACTN|nr:SDR family oxidoreductase [Glycomyces artemisiae]PRY60949.1 NAD(P)-dependent dehydrogenase (short-subunit alcohol dehydrogenase family) [Glycomyces artemisiae]